MSDTISISKEDYLSLKTLYNNAVEKNLNSFIFKEKEVLTQYAKYMLEYLAPKFETK